MVPAFPAFRANLGTVRVIRAKRAGSKDWAGTDDWMPIQAVRASLLPDQRMASPSPMPTIHSRVNADVGHLDADALAGAHEAQAAGVETRAVKGNLAAVVKQHAARAALVVIPVHAGLHGVRLARA